MSDPIVSVVIPCHNGGDRLKLTLGSLDRQSYPLERVEVIVVDQASTDGSREIVRQHGAPYDLRLVEQDGKYGPSVARNAGAEAARGSILLFLDADQVADPGLIQAHAAFHARVQDALVCGQVQPYAPAYPSFIERSARPEHGYDRGNVERDLPFYDVWSNQLSVPTDVFRRVGPFDDGLRAYEDVEFAYRAFKSGFRGYLCPQAISYHNHPRALQTRAATARAYQRALPLLLVRHPELRDQLPQLDIYSRIDLRRDGFPRLYRKLRMRALAWLPVRQAFFVILTILDRRQRWPRITKALFWRLMHAEEYVGFREGLKASGGALPT